MCTGSLDAVADRLRRTLDEIDQLRERALVFSREIIRRSATAIRLVHQRAFAEAEETIATDAQELRAFRETLAAQPRIAHAPFVSDAEKEHVEAWATLSLATGRRLPTPEELGSPPAAYLNGLAEGVSEIRRFVVDRIRADEIAVAEAILARMDEIYGVLVTFDYPDAVLEGLKRRLDTVRGVVEKTRHDLTIAVRQDRLIAAMAALERRTGIEPSDGYVSDDAQDPDDGSGD